MTAPPPAPQAPTPGTHKRRRWVGPTVAIAASVLVACCIGTAVIVAIDDDDEQPGAASPTPTASATGGAAGTTEPTSAPETEAESEPEPESEPESEPEPEPEPAGFGAGVWEAGSEIPAGTYVTIAPSSCYWARLSGFSGDFDELVANDNLSPGARGRVTISDDDAGIEFSGGCEWVEVSEAEPVEVGEEVAEGTWAVDDEIEPGTYTTDASESCYWARLSGFSGDFDDLIANDNIQAGSRGRVDISASDAGVHFSGDCNWTRD